MFYNASIIAMYIIDYCYRNNNPISNLQLQKILYFVWREYYVRTKRSLFFENICAWQFGPVVPDVYYEYCAYAGKPILQVCEEGIIEDEIVSNTLEDVVNQYIKLPVNELVELTHERGTPWYNIYNGGAGNRNIIPFSLIKSEIDGGNA